MRRSAAALLALVVLSCVPACSAGSSRSTQHDGTIAVVAAENFWGNLAAQLGRQRVHVTSIISDPQADPHLYESDPRDAAAVTRAELVIQNGAGYDDFISKLLGARGGRALTVATVLGVRGADPNPHLWYDIPRVTLVARAIVDELEHLDPAGKTTYEANLVSFNASLQPLLDTITTIRTKYGNAPVAYTERVAGYMLGAAGLDVRTPPGFARSVEDGTEPSAGDTQSMNQLIDQHVIKLLVYNAQATSRVTQSVQDRAHRAGIPVVPVTETQPRSERDYQHWQLDQLQSILAALGG